MAKAKKVTVASEPKPYSTEEGITVKALQLGYYGDLLRQPGDVFQIKNERQLGSWMEIVNANS